AGLRPGASHRQRVWAGSALVALWTAVYLRYRRASREQTAREYSLFAEANWEAFSRHYNERVPTIEEEFDIWGAYHQHRHEMRYDLVAAAVRAHLPVGGRVVDIGCGSAMVADRIVDLDAHYAGLDFGGHHITFAAKKFRDVDSPLSASFARGDAESLPFADASADVVVM